ncbi:peptidoglycan-binding protein [Brasilonema sp. CT11]|nr:peptidoglycan-binding protein [Brasilonema sp. CT11]
MEYLAYSLMDSAYAAVTADTEYHLPEFKLTIPGQKYFKSTWLSFALITTLLAIFAQSQPATAAYYGPGRYSVRTNGSCLNVRTGPSTCYRSARCDSNGSSLPRVVGYRNGFARLSTGNYVSANWIDTRANKEYTLRRVPTQDTYNNGIGGSITLRKGSQGDAVAQLQTALGNVSVTGYYGSLTQRAVRNFQARNGLRPDGVAGPETLSYLGVGNISSRPSLDYPPYPNDGFGARGYSPYYNDSYSSNITLRRGSRGQAVAELQRALANVPVTGYYDSSTQRAVRNFQASLGLRPDGVARSETLSYLGVGNVSIRRYNPGNSGNYSYSGYSGYSGISVGGP